MRPYSESEARVTTLQSCTTLVWTSCNWPPDADLRVLYEWRDYKGDVTYKTDEGTSTTPMHEFIGTSDRFVRILLDTCDFRSPFGTFEWVFERLCWGVVTNSRHTRVVCWEIYLKVQVTKCAPSYLLQGYACLVTDLHTLRSAALTENVIFGRDLILFTAPICFYF